MKKMYTNLLVVVLLLSTLTATAQRRNARNQPSQAPKQAAVVDSAQWKREHYVVNRDSAYLDPMIGLKKLMGGNRRFVEGKSISPRRDSAALHNTEGGQTPYAIIVGCSDSRVPNEIIFDQGVGDLFIIRTAGQVMAEASYGSIEFANAVLGSKLIVVLGHEKCGAVDASIKLPPNPPGHIVTLINAIKPAAQKTKDMPGDRLHNAVRQNVIEQVNELRNLESVLSKNYESGKLIIVGAVYNIGSGKVEFLQETLQGLDTKRLQWN